MSNDYWRERFENLEREIINDTEEFLKTQIKLYEDSTLILEQEIENWYNRLAVSGEISFSSANKKLTSKELKVFRMSIDEYIKKAENNDDGKYTEVLEKASASFHITKLESIKYQILANIENLYSQLNSNLNSTLSELYTNKTYNTAYLVQKGIKVGFDFYKLDKNTVNKAILTGWASDRSNFSDRIWKNKDLLIDKLNKDLVTSIITGDSPNNVISKISKDLNVGKSNVSRLVRTESAYISSLAGYDTLKELEVEEYEICATLDKRTSETCQNLDGKVFSIDEYDIGTTAPPFHPNCRSTTVPFIDLINGTRFARDKNGKGIYIDSDIKYNEWKEKYLD